MKKREALKFGLVVVGIVPVIVVFVGVSVVAWLVDVSAEWADANREKVKEGLIVIAITITFMVVHFGGIHVMLQIPSIRYAVDNYHKKCGGPDYPPCR
jgi:hypothetical protein